MGLSEGWQVGSVLRRGNIGGGRCEVSDVRWDEAAAPLLNFLCQVLQVIPAREEVRGGRGVSKLLEVVVRWGWVEVRRWEV